MEASGIPFTLVRSTQFFEFAVGIADASTVDGVVRLPSAPVQPMASSEVADAVAGIAVAAPRDGVAEFAGPERLTLDVFVRTVLGHPRSRATSRTASTGAAGRQPSSSGSCPCRLHLRIFRAARSGNSLR